MPPVKPQKTTTRTSNVLIDQKDDSAPDTKKHHKFIYASSRLGYQAAKKKSISTYSEIGVINPDPQDLFIANLENSLPKVVCRS